VELGKHALEGLDPDYTSRMKLGDIIVAGTNFGCGSSREVAPIAIKASGTSAVIAKSFARIFYRNALNIGLPIFESAEAVDGIEPGDEIEVEPATGIVRNVTRGTQYQAAEFPPFMRALIDAGGLVPYVEERLARNPT
jgi:3-isopropylmalate/(R)-2-methylmalate dehydratase small subunit